MVPLDEGGRRGSVAGAGQHEHRSGERQVLHWNGEAWSEEPIEVPAAHEGEPTTGFRVLAIADSSPANAWLLAQLSGAGPELALFHRDEGRWKEVTPAPLTVEGAPVLVPGRRHRPVPHHRPVPDRHQPGRVGRRRTLGTVLPA